MIEIECTTEFSHLMQQRINFQHNRKVEGYKYLQITVLVHNPKQFLVSSIHGPPQEEVVRESFLTEANDT